MLIFNVCLRLCRPVHVCSCFLFKFVFVILLMSVHVVLLMFVHVVVSASLYLCCSEMKFPGSQLSSPLMTQSHTHHVISNTNMHNLIINNQTGGQGITKNKSIYSTKNLPSQSLTQNHYTAHGGLVGMGISTPA